MSTKHVILEEEVHFRIKMVSVKKRTTIQQIVNEILKRELKMEDSKDE